MLLAPAASAGLVAGVGTNSSYYGYNNLVMWRVNSDAVQTVTHLGAVDLTTALPNNASNVQDVTFLSDGRVAVLHDNAAGRVVSVVRPTIAGDNLTGVAVEATFLGYDGASTAPTRLAGTKKLGVATAGGRYVYFLPNAGPSAWGTASSVYLGEDGYDIGGTTETSQETVVAGSYGEHRELANVGGSLQFVKTYADSTYGHSVEGIKSNHLNDGWVSAGAHPGSYWHTLVMDQDDSASTASQCAGRVTDGPDPASYGGSRPPNGGGTQENRLIGGGWANLDDGRLVRMFGSAYYDSVAFYVYNLDPDTPTAGELGAIAPDWSVPQPRKDGGDGEFVGQVAGDFIVDTDTADAPIPEPVVLGLLGIALLSVTRRRT
jgi:hypothetical protein